MPAQLAGVTFDESITGSIVSTSMSTLSRLSDGNSSYMALKSNGTKAPVSASFFMPIVPPV